jgi:hypothetical protein
MIHELYTLYTLKHTIQCLLYSELSKHHYTLTLEYFYYPQRNSTSIRHSPSSSSRPRWSLICFCVCEITHHGLHHGVQLNGLIGHSCTQRSLMLSLIQEPNTFKTRACVTVHQSFPLSLLNKLASSRDTTIYLSFH